MALFGVDPNKLLLADVVVVAALPPDVEAALPEIAVT